MVAQHQRQNLSRRCSLQGAGEGADSWLFERLQMQEGTCTNMQTKLIEGVEFWPRNVASQLAGLIGGMLRHIRRSIT